jgi:hypothetical protein
MAKRRVMFTFQSSVSSEPVIYELGQQFHLVTNIHRANATEDRGWIEVELEGEEKDIEAGIGWAVDKGIRVDRIDNFAGV